MAIVVLGMHRSGTSALTRVLGLLGAALPAELADGGEDRGEGHWESPALTRFDEHVLASVGSGWDDALELPASFAASPEARPLVDEGIELLERQLGGSTLSVIKDPRICRLVPLWIEMLERRAVEPRFALTIRHPLEVADSLAARNDFSEGKSLLLWLRYVLDGERDTRGRLRAFVTYDRLLDDWRQAIAGLRSALDLPLGDPGPVGEEIESFLSPTLRHHRRGPDEISDASQVHGWAADAYRALLAAADGDEAALPATMDAIRTDLATVEATLRPVLDSERQRRLEAERDMERNRAVRVAAQERAEKAREEARDARDEARRASRRAREAEARSRALHGSLSWRLTAPLRAATKPLARRRRDA